MAYTYVYLPNNVYQEALDRIRYIFDEFPNVVVGTSGGKDSTVVVNLALEVAREKNRLPLDVMFVDQEAEWTSTIEHIRRLKENPDIRFKWYQIPFELSNCASSIERELICWDSKEKNVWIRDQEPDSIKENIYGITDWYDLFDKILAHDYEGKACYLAGVRAEESPGRKMGLTNKATYKWITWGKRLETENHFTFYPIYDWSFRDVWKYIFDNNIEYNDIYDRQYQLGIALQDMRVSNLVHETALKNLFYMPEIDMELYDRLSARLAGVSTMAKSESKFLSIPKRLPYMFKDWREYRDYLLENIVLEEETKSKLKKVIDRYDKKLDLYKITDEQKQKVYRAMIPAILANDRDLTKLKNLNTTLNYLRNDYGFINPEDDKRKLRKS